MKQKVLRVFSTRPFRTFYAKGTEARSHNWDFKGHASTQQSAISAVVRKLLNDPKLRSAAIYDKYGSLRAIAHVDRRRGSIFISGALK